METWKSPGHTAVITGGASGIGRASAERFVEEGMNVVLADRDEEVLARAVSDLEAMAHDGARVLGQVCDVRDADSLVALRETAFTTFGAVHCLMNNAGVGIPVGAPWENPDELRDTLEINLMGVIHGCHAFVPAMLEAARTGVIINTASKQGITRPPGNYAYNLSKAGVVAYTESVAHALRQIEGALLTAHLLVPGFVFTPMVSRWIPEKPEFAWTAGETVEFMLDSIDRGDFYVLCPDNETPRDVDEKRIAWNAGDIIENRPALSRWHPDFAEAFARHMRD